jgi:hypothetical protein
MIKVGTILYGTVRVLVCIISRSHFAAASFCVLFQVTRGMAVFLRPARPPLALRIVTRGDTTEKSYRFLVEASPQLLSGSSRTHLRNMGDSSSSHGDDQGDLLDLLL